MAGGPINGGADFATGESNAVLIPTTVQLSTDMLNYFTSMTCLYNPHWSAYDSDRVTLPVCMFHVKKISSVYTNEVSKKRVILYEPQADNAVTTARLAKQLRRGIMQTIADNVVKQPTTYTLEVIVPFQPLGRYINSGISSLTGMVQDIARLAGGENNATAVIQSVFSGTLRVTDLAAQASEVAGKLPNMNGASFINMNSLEAMAASNRSPNLPSRQKINAAAVVRARLWRRCL